MPRAPRLDFPGALHHVIERDIERRQIFRDDADRCAFLERLITLLPVSGAALYAWALMPNHAHLLVRSGAGGLSNVMQRLPGAYATTFNHRHHRAGHLFQNRFKSTLVDGEACLRELVRDIHLNPVRSRLAVSLDALERYPWTGHAVRLNQRRCAVQDTAVVLRHFGRTAGEARLPPVCARRDNAGPSCRRRRRALQRSAGAWQHVGRLAPRA